MEIKKREQDLALQERREKIARGKQTVLSVVFSSIVFLATFLLLKWHLLVGIALAVGTYFGVYLINTPKKRFEGININDIALSEEYPLIMKEANADLKDIYNCKEDATHQSIKDNSEKLYLTGIEILNTFKKILQKLPRGQIFKLLFRHCSENL